MISPWFPLCRAVTRLKLNLGDTPASFSRLRACTPALLKTILMTCAILGFAAGNTLRAAGSRPNILFLFADDQRADTIAALGNPVIKTPNLDRLCSSGLAFNRAYMQGGFNGATCVPSRAMLLSGATSFHVDEKLLRDETWPAAFGEAGYTTFITGKWHNGARVAAAQLPDRALDLRRRHDQSAEGARSATSTDGKLDHAEARRRSTPARSSPTRRSASCNEHTGGPFFCYVPFDAPHDPHIVPADFPIRYDPEQRSRCRRTSCRSIRSTTAR